MSNLALVNETIVAAFIAAHEADPRFRQDWSALWTDASALYIGYDEMDQNQYWRIAYSCSGEGQPIFFVRPSDWELVEITQHIRRVNESGQPDHGGLTRFEQAVMDGLVAAWDAFVLLPHSAHSEAGADFRRAIHEAQRILATRIVGRLYPEYWIRSDLPQGVRHKVATLIKWDVK